MKEKKLKDKQDAEKTNGPFNIFAEVEKTVEYFECDPMKVVWHGNYINYFELGRRKLLEEIGYAYDDMEKSGYAFPIIEISAKYIGPLQYRDRALIKAILVEYENRLRIKFEIRNAKTGLITTKGISTQMAFNVNTLESCFVCPQILIEKIENITKGK
jgi:acyl-CoA thioester hydrolase